MDAMTAGVVSEFRDDEGRIVSLAIGKLAGALAKAQAVIQGAAKDRDNPFFKSKYADLASVWEACRGPLSANELAVIQTTGAEGAKVTVRTILAHSSGEWISGELTMTAKENSPQAIGSCITYARRYALAAMVGVAPEDDDGNAASGKGQPLVVSAPEQPKRAPAPEGYVYIAAVKPKQWGGDVTLDSGEMVPAKGRELITLLEQVVQEGVPVRLVTETSEKTGKTVITAVHRYREVTPEREPVVPRTHESIPF